jgi:hypothetical protein
MANTTSKTNSIISFMAAIFLLVAAMNINVALNCDITYLDYFGYEIRLTPGLRLMCLFGGLSFFAIGIAIVFFAIKEKLAKNKAHSVSKVDWDKGLKVPPELMKKVEKADSMSLDELEHLSDKKD